MLSLGDQRGAFVGRMTTPAVTGRATRWTVGCGGSTTPWIALNTSTASTEVAEPGLRGWALIPNFAPSCPETVRESPGLRSPAERLNGMPYHAEWLQNLLVSASLGGYRRLPRKA